MHYRSAQSQCLLLHGYLSPPLTPPPPQVAKLPFLINDGKWHHLCITWTTRDGMWEAFQDGVMRGTGENLAPYHPIKPQGVLVLGQEQVSKAPVGFSQGC